MKRPYIVAEIGCNHQGDIEIAKRMISIAAQHCRVDCVKFQKRDVEQYRNDNRTYASIHLFGATYFEHRQALEFSIDEHAHLRDHARSLGIDYACSVFDERSLLEILSIKPAYIKFGSAVNQNVDLMRHLMGKDFPPIHVSLGMLETEERSAIIADLEMSFGASTVFYHTTTGYPIVARDACLLEIEKLRTMTNCSIGFSNHHPGIALDIAAFALGASFIERHFTLDRTMKGTDHAASLEPDAMRKVFKYLTDAAEAMTLKPPSGLCECEIANRKKFKP